MEAAMVRKGEEGMTKRPSEEEVEEGGASSERSVM